MNIKYAARAAALAAGIGLSALLLGAGNADAAPSDPVPPCINCQPGPGGGPMPEPVVKGPNMEPPDSTVIEPPTGGGPKSGGRSVG